MGGLAPERPRRGVPGDVAGTGGGARRRVGPLFTGASPPLELGNRTVELDHPDLVAVGGHRARWSHDPLGDLPRCRVDPRGGWPAEPDAGWRPAELVDALAADESRTRLSPFDHAGGGVDPRNVTAVRPADVHGAIRCDHTSAPPLDFVTADDPGGCGIDAIEVADSIGSAHAHNPHGAGAVDQRGRPVVGIWDDGLALASFKVDDVQR